MWVIYIEKIETNTAVINIVRYLCGQLRDGTGACRVAITFGYTRTQSIKTLISCGVVMDPEVTDRHKLSDKFGC